MTALALDHLTVADTTPAQLVSAAAAAGYQAVCLFLEPLSVLPRMPSFALLGDTPERRETRQRCRDLGVGVDLAYPFTLASRTEPESFRPALETAAWLGARAINLLVYDREPARRAERFARTCELADEHGLQVALEFYPLSQVRTLDAALALAGSANGLASAGVNVDLLHLVRSGGGVEALHAAPANLIAYAQYCDGPASMPEERLAWEASTQRLLPGEGCFDVAGFARALPPGLRCSVELPQDEAIVRGVAVEERARRAIESTLAALGQGRPMRG